MLVIYIASFQYQNYSLFYAKTFRIEYTVRPLVKDPPRKGHCMGMSELKLVYREGEEGGGREEGGVCSLVPPWFLHL